MKMKRLNSSFPINILLLFLGIATFKLASCEVHYIAATQDDPNCSASSCLTLSQFAENATAYVNSHTTLVIASENHSLDAELMISHITAFSMLSNDSNSTATISCSRDIGFILSNVTNAFISSLTFIGCGGSRFKTVNHLIIERSEFRGQNDGKTSLVILESAVNISETTFLLNIGASEGGALSVSNSSLVVDSCHFKGNRAKFGGAIYSKSESIVTINNSVFTSNHATGCEGVVCNNNYGGALYINGSGTVNVYGSTFQNNTSDGDGGMAFVFNAALLISQSNAYNNTATSGGFLYASRNSNITVTDNSSIAHSGAERDGGVLFLDGNSEVMISNATFNKNKAQGHGGIIFSHNGSFVDIDSSVFINNVAKINGGITYIQDNTIVHISDSHFEHNFAGNEGGVFNGYSVVITGSTFTENSAKISGGVFRIQLNGTLSLENSEFNNNSATSDGG